MKARGWAQGLSPVRSWGDELAGFLRDAGARRSRGGSGRRRGGGEGDPRDLRVALLEDRRLEVSAGNRGPIGTRSGLRRWREQRQLAGLVEVVEQIEEARRDARSGAT